MKTFEEEKDFYKTNTNPNGQAWGGLYSQNVIGGLKGVDSDIYSFLVLLNTFPFMYSAGMSCSGSLKDHEGKLEALNYRFGINTRIAQGYCVIRTNISNKSWKKVNDLLIKVPYSQLISSENWEREDCRCYDEFPVTDSRKLFAYQIFTGQGKVGGDEITGVWRDLTCGLVGLIQESNRD